MLYRSHILKGVKTMTKYRIARNQKLELGKEIRLEKITTAERIGNAALKLLYFFIAALVMFNLIRFIF